MVPDITLAHCNLVTVVKGERPLSVEPEQQIVLMEVPDILILEVWVILIMGVAVEVDGMGVVAVTDRAAAVAAPAILMAG